MAGNCTNQHLHCFYNYLFFFIIIATDYRTATGCRNYQILYYIGKSNRQIEALVKQLITIKLTLPMAMVLLIFLFCMPLLNMKMNLISPIAMHNAIFKFTSEFFFGTLLLYTCRFFTVNAMCRQFITPLV